MAMQLLGRDRTAQKKVVFIGNDAVEHRYVHDCRFLVMNVALENAEPIVMEVSLMLPAARVVIAKGFLENQLTTF